MNKNDLAVLFGGLGAVLFIASYILVVSYAVPEPFFEYERVDALILVGGSCSAIALWGAWTIGLVAAVCVRALRYRALLALVAAVVAIFYLMQGVNGYLSDVEQFMVSPAALAEGRPR